MQRVRSKLMKVCGKHCAIYIWEGARYLGRAYNIVADTFQHKFNVFQYKPGV